MLAALAGLTPAAVSMALRNHSRISPATRRRVQELARRHGYRPDPEVTKLMHHLRSRRTKRLQATICALSTKVRGEPYAEEIIAAAKSRAVALGYALDTLYLEPRLDEPSYGRQLERILLSRGIEGVLLLPMAESVAVDRLLDWSRFSVVATTYTVSVPHFHRVVPNQFGNLVMACRTLVQRGYCRIGVSISSDFDQRVRHHFTAAIAWHNSLPGIEAIPPYIHANDRVDELAAWLRAYRPDVVVCHYTSPIIAAAKMAGLPVRTKLAVANFHRPQNRLFAAIDEKTAEIGSTAIDIVTGMIVRGDKGIPATARVTMLDGAWIDGASVRQLPRGKKLPPLPL